jgi:DNA-directed DNA polymerase III PolC
MYLSNHSWFSLRYGTLSPESLILYAKSLGIEALVLTDINNTSASASFYRLAIKHGIRPVLGIEFRDAAGKFLYTGIAKNEIGWGELCRFLSDHSLQEKKLPDVPPPMHHVYIIYDHPVKPMNMLRDYEFIGIRPTQVNGLYASPLNKHLDKLVAWAPSTFSNRDGFLLHKLLRCIDLNTITSKLEKHQMAMQDEILLPPGELKKLYELCPSLSENSERLLHACEIRFDTGLELNRQAFTDSKESDFKLISKLALAGCTRRYGASNAAAKERVAKELKTIRELDFCSYFLITWDIIRYAQSVGYHHVGRGSGANSIVAYCLHITDVDPLELDLYFERFINPFRSSPPDFDIDFSWDERDDVTDYIFKRYGKDYTALLATYNTFQGSSIIRELGKVFGLPKSEIDLIVDEPRATEKHHELAKNIFKYGRMMEDMPNYLSIHAGGVIISEKPLYSHTALQLMPKGFPITHFDMHDAEDFGFHKFDILSQRGLGHIKETVDIIRTNHGKAVDIHDVENLKKDEKVRAQLKSGQCIGCFYIESPAMRGLLTKLRCEDYVHLVAASSIIRPGVARSGMMREYISRFHQPNGFEYLHPVFAQQLGETFGVMVYQEDVMKIVHHFADLDLDESDILRRMMTGKKRNSEAFAKLEKKYFENCKAKGYSEKLTLEVWRQIESFAGYSFCKAHSASYAVESFQSLFLKTYYPKEFMVAVINNFGGFYQTEFYFHEARMCGANIHPPCVNHSNYNTNIIGDNIYTGFIHLQGFEQKVAIEILRQRKLGGPFRSLEDFTHRVYIHSSQLEILIRIDALRFTGMNKYELMWEKNAVLNPHVKQASSGMLFEDTAIHYTLPDLAQNEHDQAFDEIDLLGFPLCSPFSLLEKTEKTLPKTQASELPSRLGKSIEILGYYVCRKDTRTIKGEIMHFGTWLDTNGKYFDTTHFPPSIRVAPFRGRGIYRISGRVVEDYGFPSIDVTGLERLPYVKDGRY